MMIVRAERDVVIDFSPFHGGVVTIRPGDGVRIYHVLSTIVDFRNHGNSFGGIRVGEDGVFTIFWEG